MNHPSQWLVNIVFEWRILVFQRINDGLGKLPFPCKTRAYVSVTIAKSLAFHFGTFKFEGLNRLVQFFNLARHAQVHGQLANRVQQARRERGLLVLLHHARQGPRWRNRPTAGRNVPGIGKPLAEAKGDAEELKGVIALLLQKLQPPPLLAADVAGDLAEDDNSRPGAGPALEPGAQGDGLPLGSNSGPEIAQ